MPVNSGSPKRSRREMGHGWSMRFGLPAAAGVPLQLRRSIPKINAFALPGGPMFLHRGMIEAARTDAEVASVMAHELSRDSRHGTAHEGPSFRSGPSPVRCSGDCRRARGGGVISQGSQVGLGVYFPKRGASRARADLLARRSAQPDTTLAMANMFRTIEQQNRARRRVAERSPESWQSQRGIRQKPKRCKSRDRPRGPDDRSTPDWRACHRRRRRSRSRRRSRAASQDRSVRAAERRRSNDVGRMANSRARRFRPLARA